MLCHLIFKDTPVQVCVDLRPDPAVSEINGTTPIDFNESKSSSTYPNELHKFVPVMHLYIFTWGGMFSHFLKENI